MIYTYVKALVAEGWQYDENARMFIPKKQGNTTLE